VPVTVTTPVNVAGVTNFSQTPNMVTSIGAQKTPTATYTVTSYINSPSILTSLGAAPTPRNTYAVVHNVVPMPIYRWNGSSWVALYVPRM